MGGAANEALQVGRAGRDGRDIARDTSYEFNPRVKFKMLFTEEVCGRLDARGLAIGQG